MQFVFTHRWGLVPSVIRWIDGGPYSHCGVVYTSNEGQSRVIEATFDDGVRDRALSGLLFASSSHEILEIDVGGELQARMWALSQLNKPYDFGALPAIAVRRVFGEAPRWDAKDRWYCAEHILATACEPGKLKLREPLRMHGVESARQQLIAWGARSVQAGAKAY